MHILVVEKSEVVIVRDGVSTYRLVREQYHDKTFSWRQEHSVFPLSHNGTEGALQAEAEKQYQFVYSVPSRRKKEEV